MRLLRSPPAVGVGASEGDAAAALSPGAFVFAAITGSSPVTLIAVGSIMFPALVKGGYPENFSLGLVMTAGSLGCLVMPSLILMIYSLAVMGAGVAGGCSATTNFLPAVGRVKDRSRSAGAVEQAPRMVRSKSVV